MECVKHSAVDEGLIKGSKALLSTEVNLNGYVYSILVSEVPLNTPTLRIRLTESKGHPKVGTLEAAMGKYTIELQQDPPALTVRAGEYVIFTNKTPIGPGFIRRIGDELHVPFSISPGEGIYGGGEWFGRLNKVGQRLETYVVDAVGLPSDKTYVAYPFFWSTRGYGMLIDTYCRVTMDFGSRYPGVGELTLPSSVDIYLILSNEPSRIIKAFWELTGHPEIPPLWSFGVWYSLWRDSGYAYSEYKTQDDVVGFAEEVRRRGLPGDVIHIDPIYTFRPLKESLRRLLRGLGFSEGELRELEDYHRVNGRWSFRPLTEYIKAKWPDRYSRLDSEYLWTGQGCTFMWHEGFPNPPLMVKRLHELGFRVSIWVNPYLPAGSGVYEEFNRNGLLVRVKGRPMVEMPALRGGDVVTYRYLTDDFGAVDFTNPKACEAYASKIRELLKLGIDAVKTDYGEGAPEDGEYSIGRDPCIHNLYPVLYNKVVYETIKGERGEAVVWGRSGGLGIHRYPIRWTGDPDSSPRGMAASLRAVLSMAASGIMYSSIDIGGYLGRPSPELYVRWAQMGLLLSHSRFHGTTEREPWRFGDYAFEIVKRYIKLRYSLLPYIYSQVVKGIREGRPLVRPLVFDYPDDEAARDIEDEYMFGDSLLIAPIFEGYERPVYLPRGLWYDYWGRRPIEGPKSINMHAPLDKIPIFVKANTALPLSSIDVDKASEEALRNLRVEVYGDVEEFSIDLGPYGSVEGVRVKYGEVVEVKGFKITFIKAA